MRIDGTETFEQVPPLDDVLQRAPVPFNLIVPRSRERWEKIWEKRKNFFRYEEESGKKMVLMAN